MTEGRHSETPYFDGYKTSIASPMLTGRRIYVLYHIYNKTRPRLDGTFIL